jgi:3-isopropylmalate/(R)-2-methylmalate dehydratase large subunit
VVEDLGEGAQLLHVDRHLMHELSGHRGQLELRKRGIRMRDPGLTIGSMDHVVSTAPGAKGGNAAWADRMIDTFRTESRQAGVKVYDIGQDGQGIVHVVGPELGFTLPGVTLLCGDSHTCTHGALGALAWGIGTSELTHVLATQTIVQQKPRTMRARFDGQPARGVTAKDLILALIGKIGTAGGVGCAVEYAGEAIRGLSMEGRMTVCNMSIEGGARAGLIAPDEVTYAYIKGRPKAPAGAAWDSAMDYWKTLYSDEGAVFDEEIRLNAGELPPIVTWGTSPENVTSIDGYVPDPATIDNPDRRRAVERALAYMGLEPNTKITDIAIERVFLGSCTNGRIEDLRAAAKIVAGKTVHEGVNAMVVPGSGLVKEQAEAEGLDKVFLAAGFEWREPGCSMCLAMNDDRLKPGERCASTSNRNFEGRQGFKGRTHLVSPVMAAAAAIAGRFVDVRTWG